MSKIRKYQRKDRVLEWEKKEKKETQLTQTKMGRKRKIERF
jgi:hypothetical protein